MVPSLALLSAARASKRLLLSFRYQVDRDWHFLYKRVHNLSTWATRGGKLSSCHTAAVLVPSGGRSTGAHDPLTRLKAALLSARFKGRGADKPSALWVVHRPHTSDPHSAIDMIFERRQSVLNASGMLEDPMNFAHAALALSTLVARSTTDLRTSRSACTSKPRHVYWNTKGTSLPSMVGLGPVQPKGAQLGSLFGMARMSLFDCAQHMFYILTLI